MNDLLVKKAREGDHHAFLALLKRCDRQLMSVVCRFTGDLYDREDLYQDIFLHCFQSIRSYRGDAPFQTWLYRLALNRCIDYMRKKPIVEPAEDSPGPEIDWERREKLAAVHRAMNRLDGPRRICFHLSYVEGWAVSEIAEMMGCSPGTVKSHLDRARKKIRKDHEVLIWQPNPS
ncbi:MAG: RNA polymerase sigma factor [Acidobacteriota bacterium]|nr:RNA polymerase sigma factor [Acidobacteriota bacterium]